MSSFQRRGFADQLSIETPEQVALEFPVAGIGSRFVALLLDHLIQFGIFLGVGLLLIAILALVHGSGFAHLRGGKWLVAGVIFFFFLLFWGYFALFEAFWHGQTPGKRAMKLRVIKDSGRQITLFEALARNLLRYVDYLPGLYLAGVITMLANKRNKRLGDLAAGTLVVHETPEAQPLFPTGATAHGDQSFATADFFAPPRDGPRDGAYQAVAVFPADAVVRLSRNDLVVVEAFFARALELPLDTRAGMATRILGEMTARMGVAAPEGNPERALESLAVQLRRQGRLR